MSIYHCHSCDRDRDNDHNLCTVVYDELWCEDCTDGFPDDWEDYRITYWCKPIPNRNHDWAATHNDFDGSPDSGDGRAFTGKDILDLVQQINEYNEEYK